MTAGLDFGEADLMVESLADTDYDSVVALLTTATSRNCGPTSRHA
jgi:hypothetical protein